MSSLAIAHNPDKMEATSLHLFEVDRTLKGHTNFVSSIAMMSDKYIVSGSFDTQVKVWDLSKEKGCEFQYDLIKKDDSGPVAVIQRVSQERIISGHTGKDKSNLLIGDLETKKAHVFGELTENILSFAYDQENQKLYSGSGGIIRRWDIKAEAGDMFSETGKLMSSLVYVPSLKRLFSASQNHDAIYFYDADGKEHDFGSHEAAYILALSPDEKILASGSLVIKNPTIKLWDIESKTLLHTLLGHTNSITALGFISNELLVSASLDCSLKFWNVPHGQCKDTIEKAHDNGLKCLAISSDRKTLATGANENDIKVWKKV